MTRRAGSEWHLFLLAVQFLTRLPVPRDLPFSDDLLIRATRYYPLVGLVVGSIGAAVLYVGSLALPIPVAVLLSMAATLMATGAFHEDGLADAADGLGGGLTRDRVLEIMRDSRIGTYGAVTLGVTLALKMAVLVSVAPSDAAVALMAGHACSRMAAVQVVARDVYAREVGAKFVVPTVTSGGYRFALLTSLAVFGCAMLWFGPVAALSGAAVAVLAGAVFRSIFLRRIQGYTGDCLGGMQQVTEVGFYLGLALWL